MNNASTLKILATCSILFFTLVSLFHLDARVSFVIVVITFLFAKILYDISQYEIEKKNEESLEEYDHLQDSRS